LTTAILEIIGLHRSYDDRPTVDGIDLSIAAGEVCALLGPNGAGKPTLAPERPNLEALIAQAENLMVELAATLSAIRSEAPADEPAVFPRENGGQPAEIRYRPADFRDPSEAGANAANEPPVDCADAAIERMVAQPGRFAAELAALDDLVAENLAKTNPTMVGRVAANWPLRNALRTCSNERPRYNANAGCADFDISWSHGQTRKMTSESTQSLSSYQRTSNSHSTNGSHRCDVTNR
jgi:energy-coupling factor transporter ATP-binding protein EcfA2